MRKGIRIMLTTLFSSAVALAFQDSDLDGVEDTKDKCPNTPILVLVDEHGCPLESKRFLQGRFYLRMGGGYLKDEREERTYSLLSVAYSYKSLYISFTTRYYLSSKLYGSGMGDSLLFLGYSDFILPRLYTLSGLRLKLPTGDDPYSDGKVDITPSVVLDYLLDGYDLFLSLSYTLRGDERLRNTFSASIGAGYDLTSKVYTSVSLDTSQALSDGEYNYYISLFLLYDITEMFYGTLSYTKGLNKRATDQSATLKLGIRF